MLLDNKKNGRVGDALRDSLSSDSRLSIISGLFSIYGFNALKKELSRVGAARLLLSKIQISPASNENTLPLHLNGNGFERRLRNKLNQMAIARECAVWLEKKADIRSVSDPHTLNQNLFHIQNPNDSTIAIQGSSDFTSSGIGAERCVL